MSKKRVLIMSVSAGMGHIKAANALEKTFAADERVEKVINKDALRYTNKLFRDFYSTFYTSLVKSAPNFLGWWYKTTDEPWRTDAMRHMIDRLNTKPLVRFITAFDPHIIVCTHFMPAGIISHLIATKQLQAQLSIVVTDFDFHAMWLSRAFHRYFVAIDETKAYLEMLGMPTDRITVSGIPIDPVFCNPVNRTQECAQLGLDPNKKILLLSAGALGVSPTEFILEQLLLLSHQIHILVICGRDEELRQRIEQRVQNLHNREVRVFGYTDEMHRWMQMSDLFIGKPGGLTTAEAVASGLPMCVFNPIPGQEERNCDHLLEEGIAIKCNDLITLPFKISKLLDDPATMAQMRLRALAFAKPNAAQTVVRTLIEDRLPPLSLSREQRLAMVEATHLP
jgi:processive 1,2-diacylglycerol beta-glucosyltransferase